MSQEQLAFDSGFDRTYISLVERGVRSPTIRSQPLCARILGEMLGNDVLLFPDFGEAFLAQP